MTTISINATSCIPEKNLLHRLRILNHFRKSSGVLSLRQWHYILHWFIV